MVGNCGTFVFRAITCEARVLLNQETLSTVSARARQFGCQEGDHYFVRADGIKYQVTGSKGSQIWSTPQLLA